MPLRTLVIVQPGDPCTPAVGETVVHPFAALTGQRFDRVRIRTDVDDRLAQWLTAEVWCRLVALPGRGELGRFRCYRCPDCGSKLAGQHRDGCRRTRHQYP